MGPILTCNKIGLPALISITLDDLQYLESLDLDQTFRNLNFVSIGALETVGDLS